MQDGQVLIKIQGDISGLNKSLESAKKNVKDFEKTTADVSSSVSEAFGDVSDNAGKIAGKVKETSEAIGNMSDTADNVAGSLSDLSEATNEIADSLGNAESATGDFAETAEDLSASVDGTTRNFNNLPGAINDVSASLESMGARGDVLSGSLNEQANESSSFVGALNVLREVLTDTKSSIEDVSKALSQNNSELEKNTKDISKNAQTMATMQKAKAVYQAVSAVIKKTVAVCKDLIDVYGVQEQAETSLEAINNAMGESVGYTTAQLKNMASALQENSTFGDEMIMGAEKTLLALGTLNKDGFEKALQASADLAAAMGTDINSAAQSLSQALLDPENGLRRLKTAGIAFTDAEKEQIKTLTEAGKTQEAQMLILEKVESKYKGMAKAIADTDTGKLKQISNTWGDIKENLGKRVLDTVSPFLDSVLKKLNEIQDKSKTSNNISSLMKGETEFDDYSTEDLEKALKLAEKRAEAQRRLADERGAAGLGSSQYDKKIDDLKEEIKLRKEAAHWEKRQAADAEKNRKEREEQEEKERPKKELQEQVSSFLDANIVKTEKEKIEAIRAEATDLQAKMIELGTAFDADGPTAEFKKLGEVIEEQNEALKALESNAFEDILSEYGSLSPTAQAAEIEKEIERIKSAMEGLDDASVKVLNEIVSGLEKQKSALLEVEAPSQSILSEFGSLSQSFKVAGIEESITRVKTAMESTDGETRKFFEEILSGLEAEKKALQEAEDPVQNAINQYGHLSETFQELEKNKAVEELQRLRDALKDGSEQALILDEILKNMKAPDLGDGVNASMGFINKTIGDSEITYGQAFQSISSGFNDMLSSMSAMRSQFLQNEIDSLQAELDARLEANDITQEEEKKMMEAISNAKAKQFESEKRNSIAQAIINGALGITSIWSTQGAVPWLAAALSAMLTATTAAQVATIASQSYQGFERGGIVGGSGITGDKHPILANAGELILTRAQQANIAGQLTQSSAPIISVNFSGNVFGDEKSISEYVYNGIRNAQREGALAQW